jgi:uncharacterized delta-60 repeat protein
MKAKAVFIASVCLALLTLAVPASAGTIGRDSSFDGDGIFTWGLANPAEEGASGVTVDPSTGDLVVGNFNYPSNMAVTLVKPAGGVDIAFGGGTAQFADGKTRLTNAVAAQPDGKILAAGNAGSAGEHVFLARYRPNGNPDGSFGDAGLAKATVCGDTAYETNVFIRSDGSIAVVGDCGNGSDNNKLFVLVFRPGGGLDRSFSGDGMYQLVVGDNIWLGDATIDDRDLLTIVGRSNVGAGNERATAVRLTTHGALDTSFAGDGKAVFDFASGDDDPYAVIQHGNGVLVGEQAFVSDVDANIFLFALTGGGKLNTSFSGNGKASVDLATSPSEKPTDLVSDASGRLYISATYTYVNPEATVIRLAPNGALDTSFNGTGYAHTGTSSSGAWVTMWKAKPTVAGYANLSTDFDDLVARFLA